MLPSVPPCRSLVSPLPVSFPYPGLTVPTLPGGLASLSLPGATRLGFPPLPIGVCVLLISNLNPEVSPSSDPVLISSCLIIIIVLRHVSEERSCPHVINNIIIIIFKLQIKVRKGQSEEEPSPVRFCWTRVSLYHMMSNCPNEPLTSLTRQPIRGHFRHE